VGLLKQLTVLSILTLLLLLVQVGYATEGIPGGTIVQTDEKVPFIVVLKDQPERGTNLATMQAEAAASQASVLSSISAIDSAAARSAERFWIVNAMRIEADEATMKRIAALPGVDHVEPDLMVMAVDPVTGVSDTVDTQYVRSGNTFVMPWNLDWVETPAVWGDGNMGEGVTIAVVDTGIDGSHPAFGGRVKAFADFVNGDNTSAYDDNGHGTHCAGTAAGGEVTVATDYEGPMDVVLGVAPKADLIGAKVLNDAGTGPISGIIRGIQWAVENDADVISLSVGSYVWEAESRTNDVSYLEIGPGETFTLTLEVSSNLGEGADVYEPQFVVGGYTLDQTGQYYAATPYDAEPANLTFSLSAPGAAAPVGGLIDWDGFDHSPYQVMFKAPYVSNTGNWNGIWTLNITNNDNETVFLKRAVIAEAYESDGNTAYDQTLNNLVNGGVVAVVAAGNDGYYGTGTIGTPGTAEDVITVGATDYCMDYRASFSSIGPVNRANPYIKPDVMAPGVGILSAYPGGQYAVMDGTSMATPCVAGTAALMLAGNSTLTPAQVKQTLMETAVHITEDGTAMATPELNNLYGAGRISAYLAVEATDGLHGAPIASSSLTELFGGADYDPSVDPNTVKMLGVCWNATAGAPVAGETVNFNVSIYENYNWKTFATQTAVTDTNGTATAALDISALSEGRYVTTEVKWGDRILSGYLYKYSTPGSGGTDTSAPIFVPQYFTASPDGAITIRYPLLDIDGSAYTKPVRLVVANTTTTFFDANLTPVNGVVSATVNFADFNVKPDDWAIGVTIDSQSAGSVSFGYSTYYEAHSSPNLAICPPGSSIDIALQVAGVHSGGTVTSKDYRVDVTAFTETQILSLPPNILGRFATGTPVDAAALLEAAGGLTPVESTGTVRVTNGIGTYTFTMPAGCSVAVVKFFDPSNEYSGYYDSCMISVVYGSMSPWTLHRVTPPMPVALETLDSSCIEISDYTWPATWDQSEYRSVPAGQATLTAVAYTVNGTTNDVTRDAGKMVWLYTVDGVQTNTTGADGTCTFTLDVTGKTSKDVILLTEGIDLYAGIEYNIPFTTTSASRISPGILFSEPGATAALWSIYPASEDRWMDVSYQGNGLYQVSLHSYGPDDTPIVERGGFMTSLQSAWYTVGTEFADTFAYTGDWTKTLSPAMNGTYGASAFVIHPGNGDVVEYMSRTFRVPEAHVSYTVKPDVLVGSTVPVTITVADDDGTLISNAKVGLLLGAAADTHYGASDDDVRPINLEHLALLYPDPYSEVLIGYTDANGQVTLNFHAPSAGMALERNLLGFSDYVPYKAVCYKGDEVIKADMGHEWDFNVQNYDGVFKLTAAALPDFVPIVSAPHVVKLNKDDSIVVTGLRLDIKNQGTADFVYDGITPIAVRAAVGSKDQSTDCIKDIPIGETKNAIYTSVQATASDYGIDTSDYKLPVDVNVNVTVNPDRAIAEISYANNNIVYPVRITAPDLAAEILVPSVVVQSGTPTPIALVVKNTGEVPAVATTMTYAITGIPAETISVPALGAGESCTVWRNTTFFANPGTYSLSLEVNPNGATDYETSFANNKVTRTVNCYLHPATSIVLPQDLVLVPGTTYDLPLVVNGAENLSAYQMAFTFDPVAFTVTDVTSGAIPLTAKNIGAGNVVFNGGTTAGVSGNVTVATIRISVSGSGGDETALGLDAQLWGADEYPIPVEVTPGSAVLLLYGDANGDGTVNQADTLRVLREVVGLTTKPTAGSTAFLQTDVHENRAIEVGDAMFIAQKNAGLRDPYFRIL
jgi:subtilisin family serine protease